jgi:hypothetical protein
VVDSTFECHAFVVDFGIGKPFFSSLLEDDTAPLMRKPAGVAKMHCSESPMN